MSFLYGRRRLVRLWTPVVIIGGLSIIAALIWWAFMNHDETPVERMIRISRGGDLDDAERASWQVLETRPNDLDTWIRFIDTHSYLRRFFDQLTAPLTDMPQTSVSEAEIRGLLAKVRDPRVKTLATYWYEANMKGAEPDRAVVTHLADANPPARLANYLLAREAMENKEWAVAAQRYEREGFAFPKDRTRNLRRAMLIWIRNDMWDDVRKREHDPRYAGVRDAAMRLQIATHERDWPGILLWIWPAGYVHVEAWPLALAILSAVLWFIIAARLGRMFDMERGRRRLYAGAFFLGILSIYPTLLLITAEESFFGFKALEQPLPDAIYYIFGVGLREELCKLLLFLPLLPILKKRASRIEAMTCGALVGLGFAAEENIAYFQSMPPGAAIARFLTANFLHMSLTALVALSVYDTSRGRATSRDGFGVIFPLAVGIHGVYDFFLSSGDFAQLSILSMVLFVVIAQQFLRQLLIASSTMEQEGVLRLFVASMALLTGVSYVYATSLVGPWMAVRLIAVGLVGVAIVMYMFVRELA